MSESETASPRARVWYLRARFIAPALLLAVLAAGFGVLALRARRIDEFTRQWVVRELERRFETRVQLEKLRVTAFPEMTVAAENLTIFGQDRKSSAPAVAGDLPPLMHADSFVFQLGWRGLFDLPHRIRSVSVENLKITIPPRRSNGTAAASGESPGQAGEPPSRGEAKNFTISNLFGAQAREIVVAEIICDHASLVLLPKHGKKQPLDWDIHHLVLRTVGAGKPFHFLGSLTNAKPIGEIATEGEFGPWSLKEPGETAVSGAYNFTNADLDPFPGIAGTLSSTGTYKGRLDSLEVQGETDTPNFSLDKVGEPVPLHTEFSATVDGTNGDTFLHPVKATLGRSLIVAEGSVVRDPAQNGHYISLHVSATKAQIEDLLSLALKSRTPLMTGPIRLQAKLFLPPGKAKVLQKMILDGSFGVDDAHWKNQRVREKLQVLSRRAEGRPEDENTGSAVSDLRGKFHLAKGQIAFSTLTFAVPGARIQLTGDYDIPAGQMDFHGQLQMRARLSQTVTGAKSFFLKAFDPFFSRNGAGAQLPIAITGTRENPTFAVSVWHKKIRRQMETEKRARAENDAVKPRSHRE